MAADLWVDRLRRHLEGIQILGRFLGRRQL
jgi:hypothetical protein